MRKLLALYLWPAILINLGNAFAYLFQLLLARSLTIADFGAFNALFSLVSIIGATASIVPFAIARGMILTPIGGARQIIERTAAGGLLLAAATIAIGIPLAGPLCAALKIEQSRTALLATALLATTFFCPIAVGWLQGSGRYAAAAVALAGLPTLRLVFGLWFVLALAGGIDAALIAAILPGPIIFVAGLAAMRGALRVPRKRLPPAFWPDLGRFTLSASASALLLLGFWNLDMVLVRALFPIEQSGLYAVAALLARIPLVLAIALVNVLFPEATRAALLGDNGELAGRRVLLANLGLAGGLGFAAVTVLSTAAEPLLVMLAGPDAAQAAPLLRVLCFAMAMLALVQIIATYLLARNRHDVLVLLAACIIAFIALSGAFAASPLSVARWLAVTVTAVLVGSAALVWLTPLGMKRRNRGCLDLPRVS
jgi:O-antigen/teichoic acid export membrane protein